MIRIINQKVINTIEKYADCEIRSAKEALELANKELDTDFTAKEINDYMMCRKQPKIAK